MELRVSGALALAEMERAIIMVVAGRNADAASGVLNAGGIIVGGIGAVLVPWIATALGWEAALGTGAAIALLGAALWIWIDAEQRMKGAEG